MAGILIKFDKLSAPMFTINFIKRENGEYIFN